MGQRHQVYLRIKDRKGKKTVVGIHHQWLYGYTALAQLDNFLKYVTVQLKDEWNQKSPEHRYGYALSDLNDAQKILAAAYSFNAEQGYFHGVHALTENEMTSDSQTNYNSAEPGPECRDPRKGDNNDGITVIDLTGSEPKVAFVSLYGIECNPTQRASIKALSPMKPETYLRAYYPEYDSKTPKDREGKLLDGKHKAEALEHAEYVKSLVKSLGAFKVLTKTELRAIFPAMYKEEKVAA